MFSASQDVQEHSWSGRVNRGPDHSRTPRERVLMASKILASGVSRFFGTGDYRTQALTDINIEIEDGQFVCLVGPSGCGKSTFLRILAGLLRPSKGVVSIISNAERPVSMVFQDYSIYPWKKVLDNVRFGLDLAGVPKKQGNAQAVKYLAKLGLSDRSNEYPNVLSGGMKQRVAIARALAVEPEVLLMDEPFAAVDAQMREILQEELLALWQADQRTVVFVTHSLDEAVLLADRIIVMSARPGRIVADLVVPFSRPRNPSIRSTAEFAQLEQELRSILRTEVTAQLADQAKE